MVTPVPQRGEMKPRAVAGLAGTGRRLCWVLRKRKQNCHPKPLSDSLRHLPCPHPPPHSLQAVMLTPKNPDETSSLACLSLHPTLLEPPPCWAPSKGESFERALVSVSSDFQWEEIMLI